MSAKYVRICTIIFFNPQYYRSVHNIRIERLWVDVTSGFGSKWKQFFQILEAHDALDTNNDAHIWLLHFLFLASINSDATMWAKTWNNHTLARHGCHHQSPSQMYLHGMLQHGLRGVAVEEEEPEDIDSFGIDWDDLERSNFRTHHDIHNQPTTEEARDHDTNGNSNPFVLTHPTHLSHIFVNDPRCPFTTEEQIQTFSEQVARLPYFSADDMHSRRLLWIDSLHLTSTFFNE